MVLEQKYKNIVKTAMISAGGVGIPGIFNPVVDVAGVTAIWVTMIGAIAMQAGHPMSGHTIAKLASAAASGVSGYLFGSKVLGWLALPLILAFPVAGVPSVIISNVLLNGIFTYRLGLAVSKTFSRPSFTADDFLELAMTIGQVLLSVPSLEEINEVKSLLFG